jgi:hypothetical protein
MFSDILQNLLGSGFESFNEKGKQNEIVSFEDVLDFSNSNSNKTNPTNKKKLLINTLPATEQHLLITGTLLASTEESAINQFIDDYETDHVQIIVYGKNSADGSVWEKRRQLLKLGFREIYVYIGGLFEWLLLQEVYGSQMIPTTAKCADILLYREPKKI